MITITHSGDFDKITTFLDKMTKKDVRSFLNKYGKMGVEYLSKETPIETGRTASSWIYTINSSRGKYSIEWSNTNINNGVCIALIIQYGHGTRNGGYVTGIDYINPVLQKVFTEMADELWEEVVRS